MSKTWKPVLGILLIFLLGWFAGSLSTSLFIRHRVVATLQRGPVAQATALEKRLTHNLDLKADQQTKIHESFVANFTQRREVQKQIRPQIQALNRETLQQVKAVLSAEQEERFQANIDRIRQRFGRNVLAAGDNPPAASATKPEATPIPR